MSTFAKGLISGIVLSTLLIVGYSYAQESRSQDADGRAVCTTQIGYGMMTLGDRCYNNQVMTGRQGEYILCSQVTVTCL